MTTAAAILELRGRVNAVCEEELAAFRHVPFAGHLSDPSAPLHGPYYLRHRIETVHRIRLTSRLDALALAAIVAEDYESARGWSRYLVDELHHDQLFLDDLAAMGCPPAMVLRTPPFASTLAMVDELIGSIQRVGGLAAVAYSLFVEWNSERGSAAAVDRAEAQYGAPAVAGARRHLDIDTDADHYELILGIAAALLAGRDVELLEGLLRRVGAHLRAYFSELHAATVIGRAA